MHLLMNKEYEILLTFLNDCKIILCVLLSEQFIADGGVHQKFEERICLDQYVVSTSTDPIVKKLCS